jgi:hypothetical protein
MSRHALEHGGGGKSCFQTARNSYEVRRADDGIFGIRADLLAYARRSPTVASVTPLPMASSTPAPSSLMIRGSCPRSALSAVNVNEVHTSVLQTDPGFPWCGL